MRIIKIPIRSFSMLNDTDGSFRLEITVDFDKFVRCFVILEFGKWKLDEISMLKSYSYGYLENGQLRLNYTATHRCLYLYVNR